MRDLSDLLEEHRDAYFPAETEKGRDYGMIDPVMIDADIFGWASSCASELQLDTDARRGLEQVRLELGESWNDLPVAALPYYARLLRLADAAVQGCEAVPSPGPPLQNGIDLVARVDCNGEVVWPRSHAKDAIRSLTAAGFETLGLDLRKYPPDGGTHEAPWSSLEPTVNATNLEQALRSLEAALDSELVDYPWVLITYRTAGGSDPVLTRGEVDLLADGLTDDISFDNALLDLGLRRNPTERNEPPDAIQIDAAIRSYERLLNAGLIRLGRIWYIDGGPPGRLAPVEHVAEPLTQVRARVEESCRTATDWADWAFSCWSVNTSDGDAVASKRLGRA
ncbi:MAG: hypothetical protein GY925_30520 [Actinomycetia bacterium]|nr:hypothetical protein [Actinomycetes bacterium]